MNSFLSESLVGQKNQFVEFVRHEITPHANDIALGIKPLKEVLSHIGQQGYLGICVPAEYGGRGASFLEFCLFIEQLAKAEPGLAIACGAHATAIELIKRYASENQKARYLPLLARGEIIAALAFSEQQAGTDFKAASSQVKKQASGFLLSGKKTWVINGEIAHLLVVLCRLEGEAGHVLALVEDTEAKSIAISPNRQKLGLTSALTNDIAFNAHVLSAESLLLSGESEQKVHYTFDVAQTIVAFACVGLVNQALDIAAEYARSREQFGTNIGQFQAIQWKLADMSTELEGARLQAYRAAWSKDEKPAELRKNSAMCKWYAAKVARLYSGEAVQILGAEGLVVGTPLERFYRDAKVMEICFGTSEFQKMTLVGELGI